MSHDQFLVLGACHVASHVATWGREDSVHSVIVFIRRLLGDVGVTANHDLPNFRDFSAILRSQGLVPWVFVVVTSNRGRDEGDWPGAGAHFCLFRFSVVWGFSWWCWSILAANVTKYQ